MSAIPCPPTIGCSTSRRSRFHTQNLYDTEGNTKLDPTVLAISHASWDAVKGDMSEVLGVADQSITRRAPIGNSSSTIAGNWLTGLMLFLPSNLKLPR